LYLIPITSYQKILAKLELTISLMQKEKAKDQFEYNVLMLACVLGFLRSVIAVIGDMGGDRFHIDFLTDIGFTLLFFSTVIGLLITKATKWVIWFFYLPFIALLLISFIQAEGLQGSIEHNIFAGLILISLTMRGKLTLYFNLLLIIGTVISIIYLEFEYDLLNTFENGHRSNVNFIFATLGIIGFTYYAKNEFSKKRRILELNRESLKAKSLELTQKTDQLLEQKEKLEAIALELDEKVTSRTSALKSQNKKREEYLAMTMNELSSSYEKTIAFIDNVSDKSTENELMEMLFVSGERLKKEMEDLKYKLNAE